MASTQRQWKAAANLNLLLDGPHPPARVEKSAQDAKTREALTPQIDARNTVDFRTTSYCGLQTVSTRSCFRGLCEYYRSQLRRIPIWEAAATADGVKAELAPHGGVKSEPRDDDNDDAATGAARTSGRGSFGGAQMYRCVGILTHVHDPSALHQELQSPWELHIIADMDDDTAYLKAFQALKNEADATAKATTANSPAKPGVKRERREDDDAQSDGGAPNPLLDDDDLHRGDFDGSRLSLYTRLTEPFTGIYPGMAVGVIGEPFQRSTRGVLTGVLVRRLVLPRRPQFPWRIDRPLPVADASAPATQRPLRVHFCSGPYPRHEVKELLKAVTTQALHRGADLLIIGGPLVPPYEEYEKDVLPTMQVTFAEHLESFLDLFEETLKNYYVSRPLLTRMKVLLVSHRGDVTQVPVLPTTMYAIADADSVLVRSNPCRLSVNGVHIGINNEDVVKGMRRAMLERWPSADGSLRRVVETIVQSRLYTPVMQLPMTTVDLRHLTRLYMDVLPSESSSSSSSPSSLSANWHAMLTTGAKPESQATEDGAVTKHEAKLLKSEQQEETDVADGADAAHHQPQQPQKPQPQPDARDETRSSISVLEPETMPHIMFTPSSMPPFAYVTHRSLLDTSATPGSAALCDESALDDVAAATGVLVVNQGIWTARAGARYELRVAEVTITDCTTVAYRGASPANGVACGVLHVFKDTAQ